MFSRKKLAIFAATAAAAVGLVGLGASAHFSDSVTAQQDISIGTAQLAITSASGGEIAPGAKGCDVVTVQRSLGHSTAPTTLNTYSHLWPSAEDRTRKAADAMMAASLADSADSQRTEGDLERR